MLAFVAVLGEVILGLALGSWFGYGVTALYETLKQTPAVRSMIVPSALLDNFNNTIAKKHSHLDRSADLFRLHHGLWCGLQQHAHLSFRAWS